MDNSTTEDTSGSARLVRHIEGVWEQEHIVDPARASELIMERMAKDGTTPQQTVCDILSIGAFDPETVLRAIIQQEYAESLSPEDMLIYGAGLPPRTAEAIITLIDASAMADEAAADLQEALGDEDFSVICRQVREATGLTKTLDTEVAAELMLVRMPALNEVLGIPKASREKFGSDEEEAEIDRFSCAHSARRHVLAALAHCYQDCMESSGT